MAAEGAIAVKKTILSIFSSLNFTIFFFEDSFRVVPLERWTEKDKQKKCGFISLGLTDISELNWETTLSWVI